jgi:hypothetical protein
MPRSFVQGLLIALMVAGLGAAAWYRLAGGDEVLEKAIDRAREHVPEPIERLRAGGERPSRIIYLNREGASLWPGTDDSARNRSSIVLNHRVEVAHIPAYRGSAKQWGALVKCLRDHFAAFDVDLVDQRPIEGSYVMAVIGGTPKDLGDAREGHHGHEHQHRVTGLAPFDGRPVRDAIVLVALLLGRRGLSAPSNLV